MQVAPSWVLQVISANGPLFKHSILERSNSIPKPIARLKSVEFGLAELRHFHSRMRFSAQGCHIWMFDKLHFVDLGWYDDKLKFVGL